MLETRYKFVNVNGKKVKLLQNKRYLARVTEVCLTQEGNIIKDDILTFTVKVRKRDSPADNDID